MKWPADRRKLVQGHLDSTEHEGTIGATEAETVGQRDIHPGSTRLSGHHVQTRMKAQRVQDLEVGCERAFMAAKPPMPISQTTASEPPASMTWAMPQPQTVPHL